MDPCEVLMPFGIHAGKRLPDIPESYLRWMVEARKLSTGLATAIRAELARRGVDLPAPPPKPRRCGRCGGTALRAFWFEARGGRRTIRGECAGCGHWVGCLPHTPENVALANAGSDPTPILSFLTACGARDIDVRLVDGQVRCSPLWLMTPHLWNLLRQSRPALERMLTNERQAMPSPN